MNTTSVSLRIWIPAAFAVLASVGCGSAATDADVVTRSQESSDIPQEARSEFGVDQVIACAEQYAQVPALGMFDFEPARIPADVVRSSRGQVDGVLTNIATAPGVGGSVSAVIDGEERTITSEPTMLHLTIDVTAAAGEVGGVKAGEPATILAAFTADMPGSQSAFDADKLLESIRSACPPGMQIRAYASQVDGTEVAAYPWSVLLVADDGFSPLYPQHEITRPFGVSTLAEFEAAANG